jgi:hypothetical protein
MIVKRLPQNRPSLKAPGKDSRPNYGQRHRSKLPISTAWVESTVNEVIAKRMVKKQQMRWKRFTVQPLLTVRVHLTTPLKQPSAVGTQTSNHRSRRAHPTLFHSLCVRQSPS